MPDVEKVRLEQFKKVNKLTNDEEAKKKLDQGEELEAENAVEPGSVGINADEASMDKLVNQGLLASVVIGTTREVTINNSDIKLIVKTSNIGGKFVYNYDAASNQLNISAKNCIINLPQDKNGDLSNLNVVINGSKVTFSTQVQLNSITNKGIDNVINGSTYKDKIINNGINTIINAGKGDDDIDSTGIGAFIRGGAGNDTINASGIQTNIFGNSGTDNIFAKGINIFVDSGSDNASETDDTTKEQIDVSGINMGIDGGTGHNKITGRGIGITAIGSGDRENTTNDIAFRGANVGGDAETKAETDTYK